MRTPASASASASRLPTRPPHSSLNKSAPSWLLEKRLMLVIGNGAVLLTVVTPVTFPLEESSCAAHRTRRSRSDARVTGNQGPVAFPLTAEEEEDEARRPRGAGADFPSGIALVGQKARVRANSSAAAARPGSDGRSAVPVPGIPSSVVSLQAQRATGASHRPRDDREAEPVRGERSPLWSRVWPELQTPEALEEEPQPSRPLGECRPGPEARGCRKPPPPWSPAQPP